MQRQVCASSPWSEEREIKSEGEAWEEGIKADCDSIEDAMVMVIMVMLSSFVSVSSRESRERGKKIQRQRDGYHTASTAEGQDSCRRRHLKAL